MDVDDMIKRMRAYPANKLCRDVADALEFLAKESEARLQDLSAAWDKCEEHRLRVEELESHLKKLAARKELWHNVYGHETLYVSPDDLRAARAALEKKYA